jgi:hypothetical protein
MVEVLVVLGVVLILVGLIAPMVEQQRSAGRRTVCLAQLASHMGVISAYAGDHKDSWPFACRVTPEGAAYRHHAPCDYEVVGGIWHFAILEAYNDRPFHESLVCLSESQAIADRNLAARELDVQPDVVGGTLTRTLSMAMFMSPAGLDPASPQWGPSVWRVQRHGDVLFPSSKAALVEGVPFHDDTLVAHHHIILSPFPRRMTIAAADGSAALRSTADALPAVPPRGVSRSQTAKVERELAKFVYTAWGVRGRDW